MLNYIKSVRDIKSINDIVQIHINSYQIYKTEKKIITNGKKKCFNKSPALDSFIPTLINTLVIL